MGIHEVMLVEGSALVLRSRSNTAVNVQQDLRQMPGVALNNQTVCRRVKEVNLKTRRPAKDPKLLSEHRDAKRNFVENHGNWNIPELSNVLSTNESRFCVKMLNGTKKYGEGLVKGLIRILITKC